MTSFTCTPCECGGNPECPDCGLDAASRDTMLLEIEPDRYYIHRHEIALAYGGPEEGGWWFKQGWPDETWNPRLHVFEDEEEAFAECRHLNLTEKDRAKKEEKYEYTSVLSYKSTHYEYDVSESPEPYWFPSERPRYE